RGVVRLWVLCGCAGEVGQLGERDVHAEAPGGAAPALDPLAEFGVERILFDELEEEDLGVDAGGDGVGLDFRSVFKRYGDGAAGFHADGSHFGVGGDLDSPGSR